MFSCPFYVCGVVLFLPCSRPGCLSVSLPPILLLTYCWLPEISTIRSVPRKHYLLFDQVLSSQLQAPRKNGQGLHLGTATLYHQDILKYKSHWPHWISHGHDPEDRVVLIREAMLFSVTSLMSLLGPGSRSRPRTSELRRSAISPHVPFSQVLG